MLLIAQLRLLSNDSHRGESPRMSLLSRLPEHSTAFELDPTEKPLLADQASRIYPTTLSVPLPVRFSSESVCFL